jgi:hypothetical protein
MGAFEYLERRLSHILGGGSNMINASIFRNGVLAYYKNWIARGAPR